MSSTDESYHFLSHYISLDSLSSALNLKLSDFTVTSPFNREINYTCIDWHSSMEERNKTKKIAKLNIKKPNY